MAHAFKIFGAVSYVLTIVFLILLFIWGIMGLVQTEGGSNKTTFSFVIGWAAAGLFFATLLGLFAFLASRPVDSPAPPPAPPVRVRTPSASATQILNAFQTL